MQWISVSVMMLALLIAGCGTSDNVPPNADSPKASGAPSKADQPPRVTGFGATKEAWQSAHKEAEGFDAGSTFEPMVTTYESDAWPKYGGVMLDTPVVSYTINLPKGTNLAEAKRVALAEFPPGARFGRFDDGEKACLLASIRSAPVKQSLAEHGFEGTAFGAAFVTHTADTSDLDPNRVTQVIMTTLYPEGAADLGQC